MRVLFVAGRELSYARNEVLVRALRRFSTVDAVADAVATRSILRSSVAQAWTAAGLLRKGRHDLVVVGFYGYFLLHLLRPLLRTPVLFDAFISNYDTLCFDRARFAPGSLPGRLAFQLDRSGCRLATHVLLDTPRHVDYFVHTFGCGRTHCDWLPVGCNEDIFRPAPYAAGQLPLRVLSYNTFLPLHGVDVILQAAAQVRELPLRLKIIGAGPLQGEMLQLARTLRLENVEFCPPVAPAQLADEIAQADVCLGGHFGSSDKASRVVPGKIYQMLAVGRPIVAANSPANRDLLAHGESAFLIPPGDAAALAGGLDALAHDGALRSRLAVGGRAVFERDCSEAIVTERLHRIVHQLV